MPSCLVRSLIDFEAEDSPKWRKKDAQALSVDKMLEKIVENQMKWKNQENLIDEKIHSRAYHDSLKVFIYHVNVEEEHGCLTKEEVESCLNRNFPLQRHLSVEERETVNLIKAYEYLVNEVKEVENITERDELHGLLDVTLLNRAHELVLEGIKLPKNLTKPGEMSVVERHTTFKGQTYVYQNPENMESCVQTLLDRYNDLITYCVKGESDMKVRVYNMFKTCAWLLFELLDVHPYSDGNGRLCRLLCSYALAWMTPFPTPIYNVWSESTKADYIEALIEARKSEDRHPRSLTTMIIECNYRGWKEFVDNLQKDA